MAFSLSNWFKGKPGAPGLPLNQLEREKAIRFLWSGSLLNLLDVRRLYVFRGEPPDLF